MKRVLRITTINTFHDDESWRRYKQAMNANLTIVDFNELESTGKYLIQSGDEKDGAESHYQLEEQPDD